MFFCSFPRDNTWYNPPSNSILHALPMNLKLLLKSIGVNRFIHYARFDTINPAKNDAAAQPNPQGIGQGGTDLRGHFVQLAETGPRQGAVDARRGCQSRRLDSSRDKFAAVLESASFNEAELAEYCRKKGIYPEQLSRWRIACEHANDWDRERNRQLKKEQNTDRKRIRDLERELRRKERALAETAALIVLRKKVRAVWGDHEEE